MAVSGGADSMVLASLFFACRGVLGALAVLSVEHGLRGEESKGDFLFVRDWCEQRGVEFFGFETDIKKRVRERGGSEELCAREYRRERYAEMRERGYDLVATAHHLDDQIETVLFRVLRGTGVKGLCGMEPLTPEGIVRPLLQESKQDILEYATKHGIVYKTDSTNLDTKYDRNFLRQEIVPKLKERWSVGSAIARLVDNARDTQARLVQGGEPRVHWMGERACLQKDDLDCETACLQVLYGLRDRFGFGDITQQMANNLFGMTRLQSGKKTQLCKGLWAQVQYDCVVVHGDKVQPKSQSKLVVQVLEVSQWEQESQERGVFLDRVLYCDLDKLPKVTQRTRQEGDVFVPFGGKQKSLKKYLVDKKVPQLLRDEIPLWTVGERVMVVGGIEINDCIKVDQNTKRVAKLRVEQEETH